MAEAIKFWIAKTLVELGLGILMFGLLITGFVLYCWLEARRERKLREWRNKRD